MSVEIQAITLSDESRRLQLENAMWAATLDIGNDWERMRVGMRYSVGDSGGNLTGTPRIYMGLCSDPSADFANGPLGNSCKHFVGNVSNGASWVRSGGNFYSWAATVGGYKIASTLSLVGGAASDRCAIDDANNHRYCMMMELDKNGGSEVLYSSYNSGIGVDHTLMELTNAMEVDSFVTAAGLVTGGGVSASVSAIDEAVNGDFNAVCVAWNRSVVPLFVSEILFAKME